MKSYYYHFFLLLGVLVVGFCSIVLFFVFFASCHDRLLFVQDGWMDGWMDGLMVFD